MIRGIGTDIVAIARIENALARHGARFAARILRPEELTALGAASRPAAWLAKRFAAKEALGKALGTGIGTVSWQDFSVLGAPGGVPVVQCHGRAQQLLAQRGITDVRISLSDERDYALAFAVLSGTGD